MVGVVLVMVIWELDHIVAMDKSKDATLFPVWLSTGYCQEKTNMVSPDLKYLIHYICILKPSHNRNRYRTNL